MGQDTDDNFSVESTSGSPMSLLFALAAMAILGAATFWFVSQRPLAQKILVDEETRSVIFTTEYRTGPQADRLSWDNIVKLQHITSSNGNFEIVAITTDAEKVVIQTSSERPLTGTANAYAQIMEKPLEVVDNTRGFHKTGQE